jgi:hypothetical protein
MPQGAYEVLDRRDEALAGADRPSRDSEPVRWRELDDAVGGDPFAELVLHIVAQQSSTGAALTVRAHPQPRQRRH